jgi:hypothetical protein
MFVDALLAELNLFLTGVIEVRLAPTRTATPGTKLLRGWARSPGEWRECVRAYFVLTSSASRSPWITPRTTAIPVVLRMSLITLVN